MTIFGYLYVNMCMYVYVVGNSSGLFLVINPKFLLSDWWNPRKSFPRWRLLSLWPPMNESRKPTTRHESAIREGKSERANDLPCFLHVPQDVCTCFAHPITATVL